MTRRSRAAVALSMVLLALIIATTACAAYGPKLVVTPTGTKVVIVGTQAPNDDSTAVVSIYAPEGSALTLGQAPGTTLGPVVARGTVAALGGVLATLNGQLKVAAPGQVTADQQSLCLQGTAPAATWLMVLTALGQTVTLPVYVLTTSGQEAALGPAKLVICLPAPDVPSDPSGAALGAKLLFAQLSIGGVFSPISAGTWISVWTPYVPRTGQPSDTGTVAAPAAVAPGAVSIKVVRNGPAASTITGKLTQDEAPVSGTVEIWAGKTAARLVKVATAKVGQTGAYAVTVGRKASVFRARGIAPSRAAPALCTSLTSLPAPCVNPTLNGFTALSGIVKR